jgi:hypothetical protein
VTGTGFNASCYVATPKGHIGGGSTIYGQMACGMTYMDMGDKGSVTNINMNSLGLYVDNMRCGKLKVSPSVQAYVTATQGSGVESYKAQRGMEDLLDLSVLYKFNLRFGFLDTPNKSEDNLNFYIKWGRTLGERNSTIYGLNFDNKSGTNADLEIYPQGGGTAPLCNLSLNMRLLKWENGCLNGSLGVRNMIDSTCRGYNLGVNICFGKVKVPLLGELPVYVGLHYTWESKDTGTEIRPGSWDSPDISITDWFKDPTLGQNVFTHNIVDYETNREAVTPANKVKLELFTKNGNGLPGIVGKLPKTDKDGNIVKDASGNIVYEYSTEHVDVTVNSIEVKDIADPNNTKDVTLDPGTLAAILNKPLTDVLNGGVGIYLPNPNRLGDVQYSANLKLATSESDLDNIFPAPYTMECIVKIRIVRE